MTIGNVAPPSAATTGIATRLRWRSSPRSSSRFASRPTTRKKNAIRPSFTHCRRSVESSAPPSWIDSLVVQTDSYEPCHGEFAHRSAAMAAPSSATALPVSVLRKSRTGAARLRAHAVRPVYGVACASATAIDYGRRVIRSSLLLPERDLAACGCGGDASPAARPLAWLAQHGGAPEACPVGGPRDVVDLHVGQPERARRLALDDAATEPAAQLDREVGAAAGLNLLRLPAAELRVEGAGALQIAGVELQVNDGIGGRTRHVLPLLTRVAPRTNRWRRVS